MLVRLICFLLTFTLIAADPRQVEVAEDGFIRITTFTLTPGAICRKLDHVKSPAPVAWQLKPAWNSVYLGDQEAKPEAGRQHAGCQHAISQTTLVGPLHRGKWQIYAPVETQVRSLHGTGEGRHIDAKENGYVFETEKPAIITVTAHRRGNHSGRCREFVPLMLSIAADAKHGEPADIEIRFGSPRSSLESHGVICRALPQTIAEAAVEIPPGKYRMKAEHISRVRLFPLKGKSG